MSGLDRDAVLRHWTNEQGEPLRELSWWREADEAFADPGTRQVVLWLGRQSGKTSYAALRAARMLLEPGSFALYIAASEAQSTSVYHRKIRRPFERALAALRVPKRDVVITKRSLEIVEWGSKIEVIASNEASATGRSTNVVILDEARDIADGIYTSMAPSILASGGKILMLSTAGRQAGFFYETVQHPGPGTVVIHRVENENPHADEGALAFLRRQFSFISPAAARRELSNEFSDDDAQLLFPRALIEANVDDELGEIGQSERPAFGFLDLSRKTDLTTLAIVLREPARRPEAPDHLVVASLRVWNPRTEPTREVPFDEVRAVVADLPRRFPNLQRLAVDEGSESGSVLPFARGQAALSLRVEGFTASVTANMQLWGHLASRLHGRTISLPRDPRLLDELANLQQESFAYGARWRVVDASKRLHRDVSLAVAGATMLAGEVGAPACDVGWQPPTRVEFREELSRNSTRTTDEGGAETSNRPDRGFWSRRSRAPVSLWTR